MSYFIDQDPAGAAASEYFFISSSTGAIYVSKDLSSASSSYRVGTPSSSLVFVFNLIRTALIIPVNVVFVFNLIKTGEGLLAAGRQREECVKFESVSSE